MPARVHAVIVARPESRGPGLTHLQETLAAVAAQRHPVEAVTIVLCGKDRRFAAAVNASGAEGVVQADAGTSFAEAVALASRRVAPEAALWLLAQDTVPEVTALERLTAVLELGPSVAMVAPKLVREADSSVIASLGVSMSRGGETVELAQGQYDQGQHDAREDVLGSDVRGILLRAERRADLLPDPALGGGDEGLDMGVRARLAGHRVSLAPTARIVVGTDAVAGLPEPIRSADRRRIAYVTRLAQLHRRLTYAPAPVVPLHILSFLPIALWRAFGHVLAKMPGRVLPEWAATFVAAFRWPSLARSRARLRGVRGEWWRVDPLRVSRAERREILQADAGPSATVRPDLRFFSGGGAWTVLAALIVGVVAFPALLGWSSIGGGALLPLRTTLASLWMDTGFGLRGYGLDGALPADPFAAVVAVLGSLSPARPSTALVLLWVLALPLATLGGWFAATRITERSGLRITGAVLFAFGPMFITALVDPRPAAVIAHIVLPWLFYTGAIVHRSWGAAGAASLLFIVVAACSPSLGAVLAILFAVAVLFALGWRRFSSAMRLLWVLVPTAVFFLALIWRRITDSEPIKLLADPGLPYQGARAADDFWGRMWTLAGFPGGDPGWAGFLNGLGLPEAALTTATAWLPLAMISVVPVLLLAVLAPFFRRWRVGTSLVLVAAVMSVAALAVSRLELSVLNGVAVAVWPGALLSAAWLALVLAAVLALDGMRSRPFAGVAAVITAVLVVLGAVPGLTAMVRGESALTNGPTTTLPAYVGAGDHDGAQGATLVLSVLSDGSLAQRVIWGSSDSLGAQSTLLATRDTFAPADEALAREITDLVTPRAGGDVDLASAGIRFVLVSPGTSSTGPASAMRAQAVSALTQNSSFESIGETGKGALWRVIADPVPREALSGHTATIAGVLTIAGLAALAIAVLLALPTRTSVRAARGRPRLIGAREGKR